MKYVCSMVPCKFSMYISFLNVPKWREVASVKPARAESENTLTHDNKFQVSKQPLISKEDWIDLLVLANEVNGGHIGETTLASHAL